MVMAKVGENGGLTLKEDVHVNFPKGLRPQQIRLEDTDCSTDSLSYPSVQVMPDLTTMTALWGGCHLFWSVPRHQSGDGLAAGHFRRLDGTQPQGPSKGVWHTGPLAFSWR